jgi:predicted sulfurtransferase
MYCTGGIRCDVYSALLRQKGFKNLYTLDGGIQHYLKEEGNEHWNGSLFVFDGRMAINPALEGQLKEGEQAGVWRCTWCEAVVTFDVWLL